DPCNSLFELSLQRQVPAADDGAEHHPVRKPVLTPHHHCGLRLLAGQVALAAELVQHRAEELNGRQGVRVRQLMGQDQRRLASLQGPLREAEGPQDPGQKGEAERAGFCERVRAMSLRIVEGARLRQMLLGGTEVTKVLKRLSERSMSLDEE